MADTRSPEMTARLWFKIVRWVSMMVLLNIGVGLYACMGDVPVTTNRADSPTLANRSQSVPNPVCGDDCGSCVCCASIVVAEHFVFEFVPTVSVAVITPLTLLSDPEPNRMKRPPRA